MEDSATQDEVTRDISESVITSEASELDTNPDLDTIDTSVDIDHKPEDSIANEPVVEENSTIDELATLETEEGEVESSIEESNRG